MRDGIGSIYLDDERVLEQTSSADRSPSGKAIVYSAAHQFGFDVWLTDADTKERWNLTSTLHEDAYNPRWSPDGTRIVFATEEAVYVMRADGRGLRRLVSEPHDLALSWSPDGTRVAWSATRRTTSGSTPRTSAPDGRPDSRATRATTRPTGAD